MENNWTFTYTVKQISQNRHTQKTIFAQHYISLQNRKVVKNQTWQILAERKGIFIWMSILKHCGDFLLIPSLWASPEVANKVQTVCRTLLL